METQFELLLPNRRKVLWVGLALLGLYVGVFIAWILSLVHRFGVGSGVQSFLFGLLMALLIGMFGMSWLVRRLAYEPHLLVVEEERLRVLNQQSGDEQQFLYSDISRYHILALKGGSGLWFQYHDGSKRALGSNDFSLLQVGPALTQAIRRYEQLHNEPPKYRDISFFGNPVSTWLLGFFSLVVLAISWHIGFVLPPEPGFFVLFFSYFLFLLFCAAWYGNRAQRRNY